MTAAELEIALHRRDAESYHVDLRYVQPDSGAIVRPTDSDLRPLRVDREALLKATGPAEYGRELTGQLFTETEVATAFGKARVAAESQEAPLRVRLFIGPSAPELHNLRWETLLDPATDPADGTPLLTNQNIIFSRFLSSRDWRPVRLQPKRALTALVAIANPADIDRFKLAKVDVEQELTTVRAGLGEISATELTEPGSATLNNIVQHLGDGIDILYLVAHGALGKDGEPVIYLEDEKGNTAPILGRELVTRLRELPVRPHLIVLASCQSAGKGGGELTATDDGALAGLGPRLAEAGVPAVLAMQGNITMATVRQFIPVFFSELRRDGQIDRALAAARGQIRARHDWWMPVLFMRLKSGRIWYVPGFGDKQDSDTKWGALLEQIEEEECTPILGPGLTDYFYGSNQDLAYQLAQDTNFPLASHERDDLSQVAQYLITTQSDRFLTKSVFRLMIAEIQRRHQGRLPQELTNESLRKGKETRLIGTLAKLIRTVAAERQRRMTAEPFRTLARLPFPIYITTDTSDLLADALRDAGKDPQIVLCRWNAAMSGIPSIYDNDREPDYDPYEDPKRPLVFHLFGHINYPCSLVLTEDDYFDYLIGATKNKDLIPEVVRGVLAHTALLLLGFRLDDRNFRVLFRIIVGQEGSEASKGLPHIAAQVTPEEGQLLEPVRAQTYLEKYFQKNGDISVYWGDPETFMRDLHKHWDWDEDA